jgi:hypothetical protein
MEEIESVGVMDAVVDEMIEVEIEEEIGMAVDVQYGLTNTDLQHELTIELQWKIYQAGSAGRT